MTWINVESSTLKQVAYDDAEHVLSVRFRSRGLKRYFYRYSDVPRRLFDDLLSAPSKGKFFSDHIKKFPLLYRFEKVEEKAA